MNTDPELGLKTETPPPAPADKKILIVAVGGCGALYARCVQSCEVVAYDDLGCESVKKLQINDFPLLVAIDSRGGSVYSQ